MKRQTGRRLRRAVRKYGAGERAAWARYEYLLCQHYTRLPRLAGRPVREMPDRNELLAGAVRLRQMYQNEEAH